MQRYNKQLRFVLGAIVTLFILLAAWGIYSSIMHRGKIGVEIQTVPDDAVVMLGGNRVSSKTYLTPGSYTFTAAKQGFEKSSSEVIISKLHHYVGLTLSPISDEAKKWAVDNQSTYEEIGTRVVKARADTVEKENPLLAKLPYIDVMGPFSIDFSFSSEQSYSAYIIIKNATPAGRIRALQWIRNQGVDPADLTIQFEDFKNPTNQGDI